MRRNASCFIISFCSCFWLMRSVAAGTCTTCSTRARSNSIGCEKPEKAFGTYRRDFDASTVLHSFDQGHQAAVDEICMFDLASGCIDYLAGCKLNVIAVAQHRLAN